MRPCRMSKLYKAQTQQGHSRFFFNYIRSVGESKSKQEEDAVVSRDLADLKKAFASKNTEKRLLKEYVVRVFYAEMLGVSAEFAHIHCVNLSSSSNLLFKRTGYLATWLTVAPDDDLMYLIVSNMQRDMKSSNFLEVAAALTAASKLLRPELMGAMNADVVSLLGHPNAHVRKKAVWTLHAFYRKSDGAIGDVKLFRQALCDSDPSVMGAALAFFVDVIGADPLSQRDLVPIFISILRQITENRLPREYDYRRVPAPWLQIKLLQILAMLIDNEPTLAKMCEDVLMEVIKRADGGLGIGYAVICEAISTITRIPIMPRLIELAAEAIAKFLSGKSPNLRYAGIQALSQIVRVDPKYAQEHQQVVMACLEDADDTIRRKTMVLLFAMCNEDNVDVIVTRLIKSLSQTTDQYLRQDLTWRICDVVERFSSGAMWYIQTMNKVLLCAAEHVPQTTIQGMLKFVVEGEGKDEESDTAFRIFCVETYFDLFECTQKKPSEALYRVAAWVMGEYGFLTKRISHSMLMNCLCDMLERAESAFSQGWIIMAMMKIVAHTGVMPDNVESLISRFKDSRSVATQQRCYEFTELVKMPVLMKKVLPLDGCCEDINVDESMSFLDGVVEEALRAGARPYERRTLRFAAKEEEVLRTDAYEAQRADVVDEKKLDLENLQIVEPHALVTRPTLKRWGLKNLEEGVAAKEEENGDEDGQGEKFTALVFEASSSISPVDHFPDGTILHHVDPSAPSLSLSRFQVRDNAKSSKNEKFLNDIFGRGTKKKTVTRRRANMGELFLNSGKSMGVDSSVPMLSIQVEHVRTSTTMEIAVKIIGKTEVENLVITTKAPQNCTLRLTSCSSPAAVISGGTVELARLREDELMVMELQLVPTGFPSGGHVVVEATYCTTTVAGESVSRCVTASRELHVSNILRPPLQMTTSQFGNAWVSFGEESKTQLTSPTLLTPQSLQQLLFERASLQVVEVIGREIIAAAVLLGTERLLLCHIAIVSPNVATVTVRADDKSFAAYVARVVSAS